MIMLALADDEALFRTGIRLLIEDFEGMQVVWEAQDGKDLLDKLAQNETIPDILLLDLNMPKLNGVEAAKIIQKEYPSLSMIVLSSYFDRSFVNNMIELGAVSYLVKNTDPDEVELTIREVMEKGFYYNQAVLGFMRENMLKKGKLKQSSFETTLTQRESEILQLICEQYTTAEIGNKLFISPRTVDGHRNNLLTKLDCRNTAGLVVYALQHQLVDIPLRKF